MRKSYTDMQFAVTSLKRLKLSACLYLDFYKKYCFTDLLIFFGGEGENCYISNSLLFLSFSEEIRGGSCYLGWMTKNLFENSAWVSEVHPIKAHQLQNLAKLWAKVVGGGKKGLFALLSWLSTYLVKNSYLCSQI